MTEIADSEFPALFAHGTRKDWGVGVLSGVRDGKRTYLFEGGEERIMGSGAYDIFEANLRYARGQVLYTWRVFGPIAQTVKFPTLPATAPGSPTVLTTDVMSAYNVFVGESDVVGGYRDAIKNVFEALGTADASPSPSAKIYGGTKNRLSRWN